MVNKEIVDVFDRLSQAVQDRGATPIGVGVVAECTMTPVDIASSNLTTETMAMLLAAGVRSDGGLAVFIARALPLGDGGLRHTIIVTGAETGAGIGAIVDHTPAGDNLRIKCVPVAVKPAVFSGSEALGIYARFAARPAELHEQDAWGLLGLVSDLISSSRR